MAAQVKTDLNELTDEVRRDPARAAKKLLADQAHIRFLEAQIEKLEEEKRLARAQRFGANSEAGEPQYALFDEAEAHGEDDASLSDDTDEVSDAVSVPAHERKRPKRKPLPKDLPRQVVEHPPESTHCGCGSELTRIGTKTSEQLEVIPARMFVIEHRRGTYKCPCCEDAVPETAPMPAQPIAKSLAGPGLLADIAVRKYADGLPLYRQSGIWARHGIDLPRSTLAGWMVKVGQLFEPMVEAMNRHILSYDVLQMDETRVQVLKEEGKTAKSQSWMWVIRGGPPGQPGIRFHYDPGRGSAVPLQLLDGYQGYLQTDGYKAYGPVLKQPEITGLGCWAHARRRFKQVEKAAGKGKASPATQQIIGLINSLYGLERSWQELTAQERQQRRVEKSVPILDKIEAWISKQNPPPQSLMGKAVGYLESEWPRLRVYIDDGRLPMDNNLVENAIRPFALGRKAWLFSDTTEGAQASATLYSLIEAAKANGVNPYAYLKYLLIELPKGNTDIELLMPWHVADEQIESMLLPPKV